MIGLLFLLGHNAEKDKILLRKRAAALKKQKSTQQNGEDFDIGAEILGQNSTREVQVSHVLNRSSKNILQWQILDEAIEKIPSIPLEKHFKRTMEMLFKHQAKAP